MKSNRINRKLKHSFFFKKKIEVVYLMSFPKITIILDLALVIIIFLLKINDTLNLRHNKEKESISFAI